MRASVIATAISLAIVSLASGADVQAAMRKPTNIGAQGLGSALQALAKERDFQIVCRADLVKDLRTPGISGEFTPGEALTQLLRGTGLTYRYIDEETVTIVPLPAPNRDNSANPLPAPGESAAGQNTATSDQTQEGVRQRSFWSRFRMAQANPGRAPGAGSVERGRISDDSSRQEAESQLPQLEEIVVTAQKRSENIQSVPMSISVLEAQEIERLNATSLADYAAYIPGLQVQQQGSPGIVILSLRGISQIGSTATVATYIDDTPLGASSGFGNPATGAFDLLPFEFANVEALRGPQGTLYGASAIGGLIKFVTRKPDPDEYSLLLGTHTFAEDSANTAGVGGQFRLNAPLIPGQLAVSASYAREDTPGYIDNPVIPAKHENYYDQQAGRFALLWKLNEDLSLTLSAIRQQIHTDSVANVALAPSLQPIYGNLEDNSSQLQPFIQLMNYFTATANWNLGWADFLSAGSYSENTSGTVFDNTAVLGPLLHGLVAFRTHARLDKATEEVRLTSKSGDRFEWLAGAFYTHENLINDQLITIQPHGEAPSPFGTAQLLSTYREYAAFGDLTYKLIGGFDITAGLRWARNQQDFTQTGAAAVHSDSSQGVVTYSVSPRWHLNPDTMAYARVASGYQPGGPNVPAQGVPTSVQAATLTNYEAGLKAFLDDHRVLVDASVFYIDWNKIQVIAQTNNVSYGVNGGTARSQGLEFETQYLPIAGLKLGLNGAYTDAILTQDVPSISGRSGDHLSYIPKWSGSATVDYEFLHSGNWTARVGGGLRYVGARMTGVNHDPLALPLKSYGAADLNAEVSDPRWTIRLFVRNVTNKSAYVNEVAQSNPLTRAISQVNAVPLQPRVIGVGIDTKF